MLILDVNRAKSYQDKMRNEQKINTAIKNVTQFEWGVVDLRNCGLDEIPRILYNYPDIVRIDVGNSDFADETMRNKIKEIPDEIKNLKNLVFLNLENNEVESISPEISELSRLKTLNLYNNKLKEIPEQIANMTSLDELKLTKNPFDMLPPEIVARGIESIRNFFQELREQDYIYEVKLLIVGEGRVGKTCLSEALIDKNYILKQEESTEGINLKSWIIPKEDIQKINPKIERDLQINIWDFGGQEIYHSTHQFFLTKRSVYLLVTESRKEDSHDDFFYWLNIIKLLGDNSPVIMTLNKCDQPIKELPIKEYESNFQNIKSFNKISLKTDYRQSFDEYRKSIIQIASELPHVGNPLPKVWLDIRKEIEELKLKGLNHITLEQYLDLCKKYFRKEDSALFISEFFHDLGVLIHFQEDIDLKDIVILNHEWITKGVYKVLDDKLVLEQKGRLSNEDLLRIWDIKDYKFKVKEMISLMKNTKFDLCFELENREYLIPRLLPVDEIEHGWETDSKNSKFEFRYKFMPKGILARLIVKLNSDIKDNLYWRYGVILEHNQTSALIKEKYFENKITIELKGTNKREFLYLIRKAVHEIHKDFNNIDFAEMVPCLCQNCKESNFPNFFEYGVLMRYEEKSVPLIRCNMSLEEIEVFKLTSDIARKSFAEEMTVVCENQNAKNLNKLGISKTLFFPEVDSASVFIKIKTKPELFGLRDRDFLLDSEILRIKSKYPNLFILDYYCIENYLYHPLNLIELELKGFDSEKYKYELINQKNEVKFKIISNYKIARSSYQEFRIQEESVRDKVNEEAEVISYLNSDDIEIFFKAYSIKDHFKKNCLSEFNLTEDKLYGTKWIKQKIEEKLFRS